MQEALDRCEFAIRHQQEEIARLRAELECRDEELTQLLAWINGDSDALTVLQRTYMDPRISTSDRIKACGAAIGYDRFVRYLHALVCREYPLIASGWL
jgi:hypothetical protein